MQSHGDSGCVRGSRDGGAAGAAGSGWGGDDCLLQSYGNTHGSGNHSGHSYGFAVEAPLWFNCEVPPTPPTCPTCPLARLLSQPRVVGGFTYW